MRTLLLSLLIFLIPGTVISQHYHFVYIQGDNQQTFYLKKSGELISSSATGFVILPKLQAGTHQFIVGFPKNQWPEYEFQVEIKSSDRGFTLKNFNDKGWGLFDLQSLEVIMGKRIDPPKVQALPETPKSNDPFAVILASAVGDEGIRETALVAMKFDKPAPVAVKTPPPAPVAKTETAPPGKPVQTETAKLPTVEEPKNAVKTVDEPKTIAQNTPPAKTATQGATVKEETKVVAQNEPAKTPDSKSVAAPPPVVKTEEPVKKEEVKPPPVVKTEEPVKKEEVKAPPAFESAPVIATIPAQSKPDSVTVKSESKTADPKNVYQLNRQIRKISEIRSWKTTELIFIDTYGSVTDTITVIIDDVVQEEPGQQVTTAKAPPSNRTDCKEMASEKDMLNLRKKVLRQKTEEEMLELTLKDIKSKCYSVDMLQSTSYVFVSDKMRYSLFEGAYAYIYDPSSYSKLERLLSTEEYINRFRDLIKSK